MRQAYRFLCNDYFNRRRCNSNFWLGIMCILYFGVVLAGFPLRGTWTFSKTPGKDLAYDPPSLRARHHKLGLNHAAMPLCNARGPSAGLRQDCTRKGSAENQGGMGTRAAECTSTRGNCFWPTNRKDICWVYCHRDIIRHPRHGPVHGTGHICKRFSGSPRLDFDHGHGCLTGKFNHRLCLCLARPQDSLQ